MPNPTVFLDRDGTIIIDEGYLGDPDKVKFLPGVPECIKKLKNGYNFQLIVISNQSGIARGLITHEQVNSVNTKINSLLSKNRAAIDSFYYCPHHPDFSSGEENCGCRKPSPDMVFQASKDFDVDLAKSYFIGDKASDVECGLNAGIKAILLSSDNVDNEINLLQKHRKSPSFVAQNFMEACDFIINDFVEKEG
ncbi:MAG: HAD family hydrolase [Ignavibacteria bacterium]|jgi:D,D-heptose 1,7-bisphosphate phosphatase